VIRFLFAACLVLPLAAHAAGLGRLTVLSALGEPLRAEVEITSLQPGEADGLTARLGSPEAFKAAGIEYASALMTVRLAMDRRDGRPILRLSSTRPIDDPFLDVIIELQWSTGRLVREYTFLLDPPQYREKPAAAAQVAPAPSAQVAQPAPVPAPAAPEARPLAPRPSAAAPTTTGNTYEVKKGDTLGKIARENMPEGVTMQQMLVALYRANQSAFIQNNMNLVRAGRILQIPDREAAAGVTGSEATSVVRQHTSAWNDYRGKLGAAVAAKPADATPGREATGRITAKPEAPAPGAQRDQLKLSKADAAKSSGSAARAAREDDKTSSDRALKEAQSRVTDLEKNVTDLQKLLEIKNKQLAQIEQQGKPAAAPAADAPKPAAAEAPKPTPAPVAAAPAPTPAAEAPKPAAEAPKPAAEAPKPTAEAPKPAAEAPKPAPAPAAPKPAPVAAKPKPAAVTETSLVDEFLGNPMALGGLGGVILLLIGYGAYAWRKKKANASRFQDGVLAAAPPAAASHQPSAHAIETAAAVSAAVAATQATAAHPPETDDVDPIAEADVYLAYGRDTQAEEILNEALSKHPDRVPVHAKLLEIFAHRHDAKAFEKTAKTIHDLTNGSGPEWDKARALGHTVDPGNPLYGGGGEMADAPAVAAAPAPAVDFDLGGGAPSGDAQPAAHAVDFDIGAATTAGGQAQPFKPGDTMILLPGEAAPDAAAPPASEGLDFDINAIAPAAPAQPEAAPKPASHDAGASLDFDLDLDLGAAKPAAPAAAPVDITTISLDLGKPGSGSAGDSADPRWQEVATKLDLAKAYQGMGDKEGARELLNEVISQGDSAQQNEAKQMLAALG
jgi:pilus assembly protein FimV